MGLSVLNRAYQCLKRRLISDEVAGLDLDDKPGCLKAKTAAASYNIDGSVGTGR